MIAAEAVIDVGRRRRIINRVARWYSNVETVGVQQNSMELERIFPRMLGLGQTNRFYAGTRGRTRISPPAFLA